MRSGDPLCYYCADYGLDVFMERKEKSDFPWIISNVIDTESGQPLGGGKVDIIIMIMISLLTSSWPRCTTSWSGRAASSASSAWWSGSGWTQVTLR